MNMKTGVERPRKEQGIEETKIKLRDSGRREKEWEWEPDEGRKFYLGPEFVILLFFFSGLGPGLGGGSFPYSKVCSVRLGSLNHYFLLTCQP